MSNTVQEKVIYNRSNQAPTFRRDPAAIGRQLKRPSAPAMQRSQFMPPKQAEHVALLFKRSPIQQQAAEAFAHLSPKKIMPTVTNCA